MKQIKQKVFFGRFDFNFSLNQSMTFGSVFKFVLSLKDCQDLLLVDSLHKPWAITYHSFNNKDDEED